MKDERAGLIQEILDLQTQLYRSLRPAHEWLEVDLTMPQLKVLFLLYSEGSASMGHLASSLGVTLSTVTGIVDRLVEHDLVERREDPHDRRLVLCRLTARGSDTVDRLQQAGRSHLADLLQHLPLADLRSVAAGLDVLVGAARHGPVAGNGAQDARRGGVAWAARAAASPM